MHRNLTPDVPTQESTRRAGLNALAAALAFGATKVVITDVREDNLPLAERLGAKFPLLTPPGMSAQEAAKKIRDCLPPDGPDCVIDCAGYDSTLQVRHNVPSSAEMHCGTVVSALIIACFVGIGCTSRVTCWGICSSADLST